MNTLKLTQAAMTALLLISGVNAVADSHSAKGGYIGAGYGWFDKESDDSLGVLVTVEETDPRFFAGYRFNRYLSLQFDAIFSKIEVCVSDVCDNIRPILGEASVRPAFPIGRWLEIYGRVGYVAVIADDGTGADDEEATWAVGLEVRPWKNLFVRGEYFGAEWKSDSFKNGGFGLNLGWNFFSPH